MPALGDVEIQQNGLVVSDRDLGGGVHPLDVFLTNPTPIPVTVVSEPAESSVVSLSAPSSAALTQVPISAVSVVLLASNAARRKFLITNGGNKALFIAFAATATTAAYTLQLPASGFYESDLADYTGVISGIWANAGAGSAQMTELT